MPQKTKTKGFTSGTRKGSRRGKKQPPARRPRRRSATKTPAVISDSIFTLTLRPKGGCEILFAQDLKSAKIIYDDLRKSLHYACETFGVDKNEFDPIKYLDSKMSIDWLVTQFKKMVPANFHTSISNSNSGYSFMIWRYLESPEEWLTFEIKRIVAELEKKKLTKLLNIFILFLRCLQRETGIPFWFDRPMDYVDDIIEEDLERVKEEGDPEDIEHIQEVYDEYNSGQAYKYKQLLNDAPPAKADEILSMLNDLKSRHPLASLLKKGCRFISSSDYSLWDLEYVPDEENEEVWDNGAGLRFTDQVSIMWDLNDMFTHIWEDIIDSHANEGVHLPGLRIHFDKPGITKEKIDHAQCWFDQYINLIREFNKLKWKK